jgi:hypothetical protein
VQHHGVVNSEILDLAFIAFWNQTLHIILSLNSCLPVRLLVKNNPSNCPDLFWIHCRPGVDRGLCIELDCGNLCLVPVPSYGWRSNLSFDSKCSSCFYWKFGTIQSQISWSMRDELWTFKFWFFYLKTHNSYKNRHWLSTEFVLETIKPFKKSVGHFIIFFRNWQKLHVFHTFSVFSPKMVNNIHLSITSKTLAPGKWFPSYMASNKGYLKTGIFP